MDTTDTKIESFGDIYDKVWSRMVLRGNALSGLVRQRKVRTIILQKTVLLISKPE